MQTMRLSVLQAPSRVQMLLESLLPVQLLRDEARRITEQSELPSALQKIVIKCRTSQNAWSAWTDAVNTWLFTAEMSLALSRERGRPTLHVGHYDMDGRVREWQVWALLNDGTWQQCTV